MQPKLSERAQKNSHFESFVKEFKKKRNGCQKHKDEEAKHQMKQKETMKQEDKNGKA